MSTELSYKNSGNSKSICGGLIRDKLTHEENSGKGTSIHEEEHAKGKSIKSRIIGNIFTHEESNDKGKLICNRIVGSVMKRKLVRNKKIPPIKIQCVNDTWKNQ